ncbi:MAG: hypothetical protein CBC55_02860 [Gammaproteobacteria bacterium TMED95]|nr:MAG: hypothetical protein CBC55_02860 [Gammaproteobacteria bacterium TMED95]|tara:strand:- start:10757 stop:11257 length:501 start_codon:yes stop_codon:yes gene_type:complete
MEVVNTGFYDNERGEFVYLEEIMEAHWLQHLDSEEYMIVGRDEHGFESYGTSRDEELLFSLADKTLEDDVEMRTHGWRVLPQEGRLFCSVLGLISLSRSDMVAVEQGVKDALENRMNGRAGVDIKKLKIDSEFGNVSVDTNTMSYVDMGYIEDYISLPEAYKKVRD